MFQFSCIEVNGIILYHLQNCQKPGILLQIFIPIKLHFLYLDKWHGICNYLVISINKWFFQSSNFPKFLSSEANIIRMETFQHIQLIIVSLIKVIILLKAVAWDYFFISFTVQLLPSLFFQTISFTGAGNGTENNHFCNMPCSENLGTGGNKLARKLFITSNWISIDSLF